MEIKEMISIEKLKDLGFNKAVEKYEREFPIMSKVVIAKEHYRYVTQENFGRAQEELKKKTFKRTTARIDNIDDNVIETFCQIACILVENYEGIPPMTVLEKMEAAKKLGCFDDFEIATVERVEKRYKIRRPVPDPILFGRISGCDSLFFIAEWGNDISIADILHPNEG